MSNSNGSSGSSGYTYSLSQIAHDLCQAKKPLIRTVYFTQRPIGRAGSVGQMNKGDLVRDPYSKAIYFDPSTNLYHVMRHNETEERVPAADIIAIMRSFLRMAPVSGAFVTVADADPTNGRDTIIRVVRSFEVDPCDNGGQLMMPLPGVTSGGPPPGLPPAQQGQQQTNWKAILLILLVVAIGAGGYYYFVVRKNPSGSGGSGPPPPILPQPYILRR